jgi:hypothetical protein
VRATAHVGVAVGRRCALELNTVPPGDIKVKPDWSAISWWDSHYQCLLHVKDTGHYRFSI